jgi:hypothetical protein
MADETHGIIDSLPNDRAIRTNQTDILHGGGWTAFVEKGYWEVKATLWWNLDYLTYRFYDNHQEYDYCITMDYDACINLDVDKLMKDVAAAGYDFVALPMREAMHDWYWQRPHAPVYSLEELQAHYLCVIIISRKAANYLAHRRKEMAVEYTAGNLKFWPFCEAFMSTELRRGGFRVGNLADFGNVDKFGWWPVYNENDIIPFMPEGFIHPVMDEQRFLPAYIQRYKPMSDWCRINGPLWKQLRQFPFSAYASYIWPTLKMRALHRLAQRMGRL